MASVPLVNHPYSRMLAGIQDKKRIHKQSTWGDLNGPEDDTNICGSPMCTAGHLVQMGGAAGWALRLQYGWATAASLIHAKAHPDVPPQNFRAIPQDWALAYIETMAEREATAQTTKPPSDATT